MGTQGERNYPTPAHLHIHMTDSGLAKEKGTYAVDRSVRRTLIEGKRESEASGEAEYQNITGREIVAVSGLSVRPDSMCSCDFTELLGWHVVGLCDRLRASPAFQGREALRKAPVFQ